MYDNNFFHPPAIPDFPYTKDHFMLRRHKALKTLRLSLILAKWKRDVEFLYEIYANARNADARTPPLGQNDRHLLLTSRFMAEHINLIAAYPHATYAVLCRNDQKIGRVYAWKGQDHIRLIDITLHPHHRKQGIGESVMTMLNDEADRANLPVTLLVERGNPSQKLYGRMGYETIDDTPPLINMLRQPRAFSSQPPRSVC